ncbi:MAG: DUF3750 domain-containing protein [Pseudomonadota bacterium]
MNSSATDLPTVSLWSAKIPLIGFIAVHHWFVIERGSDLSRWEVWQSAHQGGTAWGHLHRDLMAPFIWPHRDTPVQHQQWHGNAAQRLADRIETSPQHYPWLYRYRYWPGPNSNTYVQWVLQQNYRLGWKAAGKHYSRLA